MMRLIFWLEQTPTAVPIPSSARSYKHESTKNWHMIYLPFRAGAERKERLLLAIAGRDGLARCIG